MSSVIFLDHAGEWWTSLVGLGGIFFIAAGGAVGLGVWVMRADRLNRLASTNHADQHVSGHEDDHS
jgi:hypothetical protein